MQPCEEDVEEEAAVNVGQRLGEVSPAVEEEAGVRVLYNLLPAGPEDEAELLDTSDPLDSTASPEELDEEENSGDSGSCGGGAGGSVGDGGGGNGRTCTYEGCQEMGGGGAQGAKQRKPWMCKKHRNKVYKDKYKRKKSDQATSGSARGAADCTENAVSSMTKQKTSSVGDRPARPSLLEQVLNQKRLSLLRSPTVVQFLKTQQQLLSQQTFEPRRPFPEASV
ncbi:regulatory factor X-associated protein [Microcaecilia unicolor]|uniref:Regulatory factor X-associated protein n=1 Tax=Microcaecilia unicolor TaxID=1415580 RepID=A0A6P7XTB9_9AMPH|nr:regulatory factor X-associated protein [Microcaecilia unicolor]